MKKVYFIEVRRMKQFLLVCMLAFFTALFLFAQNSPLSISTMNGAPLNKAVYQVEGKGKKVALTFDISWGDERALPIINELKDLRIKKATFFLSASWAERHPEIVKAIVDEGFEIGTLGYRYTPYTKLTIAEIRNDIARSIEVFNKLGIKKLELIRPPSGYLNEDVLKVSTSNSLTVVQWSKDSKDWLTPGTKKIIKNSSSDKKNGDIILLHASDSAIQTKDALKGITEAWESDGYQFVTVGELISNTSTQSEEIE